MALGVLGKPTRASDELVVGKRAGVLSMAVNVAVSFALAFNHGGALARAAGRPRRAC